MLKGLAFTLTVWAVGAVMLRLTVAAPQQSPDVSLEILRKAQTAAAEWIAINQNDDGSYVYEYDIDSDSISGAYNEVRHAGVTMSLYQLAANGDLSVLPVADRAMARMERSLYRANGWAAVQSPTNGTIKLGSTALALAGLAQRRLATGDTQYDELMGEMGNFLLAMQLDDGSFLNYWLVSNGGPDPGVKSLYSTGEAFWAMAMMRRAFPDDGWEAPTRAVADYISLERDAEEEVSFPPWADQWAAYGLAEMADWPLNDDNIAYARTLAARFGFLMRIESQRASGPLAEMIHGSETRAAGMGTWVEGLTSLWRLASIDPRMEDMEQDLGDRALTGAGLLAARQVDASGTGSFAQPELAGGAWFIDGITRMDDQQHAISGLLRTEAILDARAAE
jgi:hypothetical protein